MAAPSKIKVLIADDHPIIRFGIRSLLENCKDIKLIGEAINGEEAVSKVINEPVDLVIMDIKMPVLNGIEATAKIKSKKPWVKVLSFSMYDEHKYIVKMLEAGASGYILKNTGKAELISAIYKLMNDENYFSVEVASVMVSPYLKSTQEESYKPVIEVPLTKREEQVLRLICLEYTNPEIGKKLLISVRTVDTHRRNILQKLEVKNTAGLVRYAMKTDLLERVPEFEPEDQAE